MATIMTVDVGYAGQPLIEEMLDKIRMCREWKERHGYTYKIEIDGCCNKQTFKRLCGAGAEVFVMGSSLFNLDADVGSMKRCVCNLGAKRVSDFMNCIKTIFGIDLGAANIRSAFVDVAHNLEGFAFEKTGEILPSTDTPDRLVAYIATRLKVVKTVSLAITLGVPSTVDRANKVIFSTPNTKGLDNVDIAAHIEKACNIPVFVVRDVNLLLLHDIYAEGLKTDGCILGFYVGTGFGNAISINGKIVTGKHGVAGELGHIPSLSRRSGGGFWRMRKGNPCLWHRYWNIPYRQ